MGYYRLLGLEKEPFSNSPNPEFFYLSPHLKECVYHLEISLRLKRGLNLILGDVGTGKTTLSRLLIQQFSRENERFLFHLILDPIFKTPAEFLGHLLHIFGINSHNPSWSSQKEALQHYLFQKGVNEGKIVILFIDEGQNLNMHSLEILRNLLNYETNECKLLQIIIFAQLELLQKLRKLENFIDRANFIYTLKPFNLTETEEMIRYRLLKAGLPPGKKLFTKGAFKKIHRYSQGKPRKIITLCHHALITMLIKGKEVVDKEVVGYVVKSLEEQTQGVLYRWINRGKKHFPFMNFWSQK
ncbi:MAG: AAA family ATPase [Candidatus Desulfofervidaceae bacterium]|nr:AAA family ATPase [Candidatus Desulfofervidaceae bacterium]MDL1969468.1 AAA family ATPase [Candidatus Desulfofervidaceae bacterium]